MDDLAASIFRKLERDKCVADSDLLRRAFVAWMAPGRKSGYSALAGRLNAMSPLGPEVICRYPYNRVADGLVQRLRVAGLIQSTGREWQLTGSGRKFLEHLNPHA